MCHSPLFLSGIVALCVVTVALAAGDGAASIAVFKKWELARIGSTRISPNGSDDS